MSGVNLDGGVAATVIRTAFVQENQAEARQKWRETADKLRERFAKVADLMDSAEDDVCSGQLAPLRLPPFPIQRTHLS